MKVLLVEPMEHPKEIDIQPTLEEYYKVLDCDCITATYPWPEPVALVTDDNGLFTDKLFRRYSFNPNFLNLLTLIRQLLLQELLLPEQLLPLRVRQGRLHGLVAGTHGQVQETVLESGTFRSHRIGTRSHPNQRRHTARIKKTAPSA